MGKQEIGRLAMRVEGDWWTGYYALPDTMDGALELGRIKMAIVADPHHKRAFMGLMKAAVGDIFEDRIGVRPDWPEERPAPEHERSGRA